MCGCFATAGTKLCASLANLNWKGMRPSCAKRGDRLEIEPVCNGRLLALLATLDPIDTRLPDVDGDLAPLDDVEL